MLLLIIANASDASSQPLKPLKAFESLKYCNAKNDDDIKMLFLELWQATKFSLIYSVERIRR